MTVESLVIDPARLGIPARHHAVATQNQRIILTMFKGAGFSDRAAAAALVNAIAESQLDHKVAAGQAPWSWGVAEDSAGLFQLNAAPGAAGAGMSLAARQNPVTNTSRIIQVAKGSSGSRFRSQDAQGASIATLTALFTEDIERPANRVAKGQERANLARSLYGSRADSGSGPESISFLPSMPSVAKGVPTWVWILVPVVLIGVPTLIALGRRR